MLEVLRQRDIVYREGGWTPGHRGIQMANFEFPAPIGRQPFIRFPSSEVITLPRHTRTENLRVVQAAACLVPHPALARVAQLRLPVAQAALRTPIYRLARRSASKSATGPSQPEREAAEFTVHVVAHDHAQRTTSGTARGRDPYQLTAAALALAARHMPLPEYDRAGVLAPSQAFDPDAFLGALEPVGLAWSVQPN